MVGRLRRVFRVRLAEIRRRCGDVAASALLDLIAICPADDGNARALVAATARVATVVASTRSSESTQGASGDGAAAGEDASLRVVEAALAVAAAAGPTQAQAVLAQCEGLLRSAASAIRAAPLRQRATALVMHFVACAWSDWDSAAEARRDCFAAQGGAFRALVGVLQRAARWLHGRDHALALMAALGGLTQPAATQMETKAGREGAEGGAAVDAYSAVSSAATAGTKAAEGAVVVALLRYACSVAASPPLAEFKPGVMSQGKQALLDRPLECLFRFALRLSNEASDGPEATSGPQEHKCGEEAVGGETKAGVVDDPRSLLCTCLEVTLC